MKSSKKFELYQLKPSLLHFKLNLVFYFIILAALPFLIDGIWLVLCLLLNVLVSVQYLLPFLQKLSSKNQIFLELRDRPARMIWYDYEKDFSVNRDEIKVYDTRWFILIRYKEFYPMYLRLFLVDHFEDQSAYCSFRRWIREQDMVST